MIGLIYTIYSTGFRKEMPLIVFLFGNKRGLYRSNASMSLTVNLFFTHFF